MEESQPIASPAPPDVPARRRTGFGWIAVALLLAAIAFVIWWAAHGSRADQAAADSDAQRLAARVDALEHTLAQLRGNAETLRSRLDDGDKVDQSVREQLLSIGERTRLLEDSVANLADKRLSGHDTLALDEAELLLTIGGERFALFRDSAAAIAAYRLADTSLSEVQDAAFSTVRQSIKGEIAALGAEPAADPLALLAQLSQLDARIAQLPAAGRLAEAAHAAQEPSRLARIFGAFVQVHREDDAVSAVAAADPSLARELASLDLHAAEAAALARDQANFRTALAAARNHVAAALAPGTESDAVVAQLDAMAKSDLIPASPDSLGSALKELRSLRTSHALRAHAESSTTDSGEAK